MDSAIEFTTVIGVDYKTIRELQYSHQTWRKFAPEIWQMPMVAFFDRTVLAASDLMFLEHPNLVVTPWPPVEAYYANQREKMLTGFVHVPPRLVKTPWWVKIDTDAVRLGPKPWMDPRWFRAYPDGRYNAFVGNRWSYTKPADQMEKLDDWGDNIDGLKQYKRLDLPYEPNARRCSHPNRRLASWICFFRTEWSAKVAGFCKWGQIPVPSEDGYHFYCAERRHDPYALVKFKGMDWTNIPRLSNLISKVQEVLAGGPVQPE